MFLEVCFLNFRYFFITFKHINISDKVNYMYFIYHKTITDVKMTISHFALKTSVAFFKFMKLELKYLRFANSNDMIFKTDLDSLKCNASLFKMSRFFIEKVACEYRHLSSLTAGGTLATIPAQFYNIIIHFSEAS